MKTLDGYKFKTMSGNIIDDPATYVKEYFNSRRRNDPTEKFHLYIGTDSLKTRARNRVVYATVICMYIKGKGGHVIYNRTKRFDIKDMYTRLWEEVEYTAQVTKYLEENNVFIEAPVEVHLDLSSNLSNKSSSLHKSAIGYVESMGFSVRVKPDASAASYIADHIVRI